MALYKIDYAHQIIHDTRKNKPFENREVEVQIDYLAPEFPDDLDAFKATVLTGEFAGESFVGDNFEDAVFEVRYNLMDKSRKAFAASTVATSMVA